MQYTTHLAAGTSPLLIPEGYGSVGVCPVASNTSYSLSTQHRVRWWLLLSLGLDTDNPEAYETLDVVLLSFKPLYVEIQARKELPSRAPSHSILKIRQDQERYYCPETTYLNLESYDMNHGPLPHGLCADVPATTQDRFECRRPAASKTLGPREPPFVKQYARIVYTLVAQNFQSRRLAASRTLEEGQVVGTAMPLDLLWRACMALSVWINVRLRVHCFLRDQSLQSEDLKTWQHEVDACRQIRPK
ncbi:hypothetical protein EDD85DRAFT_793706 [Armillaria nabsnona]|nr:hypothetical protein EDD85DRAFT_793706 [Armillaria nabsnona]